VEVCAYAYHDRGKKAPASSFNIVVLFLLSDSPVSEFYVPTFRNTLYVPSS
jgi:hypothetical protein